MKSSTKKRFLAISMCSALYIYYSTSLTNPLQAAEWTGFDKNTEYDVHYVVNEFEIHSLVGVRVLDIVSIGKKEFLVVQPSGFGGKGNPGYVLLTAVRSILPTDKIKVKKTQKVKKQR